MKVNFIFLLLFLLVPSLAQANMLDQFLFTPGGCNSTSGVTMSCSRNFNDGLFSAVACKVMMAVNKGVVPLYCSIVTSDAYLSAINSAMVLFVMIWGISFLIGSVPVTAGSAIMSLIKLIFIYIFATNVDLFFGFIYPAVIGAPADIVGIMLDSHANTPGSRDFYEYVDKNLAKVFNSFFMPEVKTEQGATTRVVDVRLMVLGVAVGKLVPGGGVITGLFFLVISGWILTYLNIMVRYLLSLIGLIFLLMLTPLFLPTLMFNSTKYIGDEWIKMILSFIIQLVVVVMFLLMVEHFFVDFMDLIRLGFNNIVLEKGYEEHLSSQGKTQVGQAVDAVYKNFGFTIATSEKYVNALPYYGDKSEFVPWFVFKLLISSLVMYFTYQWMEQVPAFAAIVAGNPRFSRLMQGYSQGNLGAADKSIGLWHEKALAGLRGEGKKGLNPSDSQFGESPNNNSA